MENFDGAEAVPNPEAQQILNAEADADPGNNLIIASWYMAPFFWIFTSKQMVPV